MSFLIKGMDMPEKCEDCPCYDYIDYVCRADDCFAPFDVENPEERSEHCPLVEIPTPHGRLIDADYINGSGLIEWQKSIVKAEISQAPTVVEAEGVNE